MDKDSYIIQIKKIIFIKILQMMLKLDLILQIMNWVGCYQKEKMKIRLMKDKLG